MGQTHRKNPHDLEDEVAPFTPALAAAFALVGFSKDLPPDDDPVVDVGTVVRDVEQTLPVADDDHGVVVTGFGEPAPSAPEATVLVAAITKPAAKPAPKQKATKKEALERKQNGDANLSVGELFSLSSEEIARLTKEVYAEGRNAIFRFFFKPTRTTLVMSVVPVRGQSVMFTVVDGEGWLIEDFPVGTAITLEEVREPVNVANVLRLKLITNFRGVMNQLLLEQLRSLSDKLSACQRRSRPE